MVPEARGRPADVTFCLRHGRIAQVYRWAAQDGPLKGLYRIFLYEIQSKQFHIVLLYNRGTEPHTMYWAAILGGPAA